MMKDNRPEAATAFPHINGQTADLPSNSNDTAGDSLKLSNENSETAGNRLFQLLDNPTDLTDSPTIVKSRSLSKKIRERQSRDRAISGSEPEKGIPTLVGKPQSNMSTPVRSRANSSSVSHAEVISESVSTSLSLPVPLNWSTGHSSHGNMIALENDAVEASKSRTNENSAHPTLVSLNHVPATTASNGTGARGAPSPSLVLPSGAHPVPVIQPLHHNPKPVHSVPNLSMERSAPKALEKLNTTEHVPAGSSASQPSSGRQHSSHSRSVPSIAPTTNKLSALSLSPATATVKARASSSSTSTIMSLHGLQSAPMVGERQFLIALDTVPKTLTIEDDNDRIVQERLLEAKAMDRKNVSGAVMHQFSLWNKAAQPTAAKASEVDKLPAASIAPHNSTLPEDAASSAPARASAHSTNKLTAISHIAVSSDALSASNKKPSKLRGPKAAREVHSHVEGPERPAALGTHSSSPGSSSHEPSSSDLPSTAATTTGGTPCEESKTATNTSLDGALDDDYAMDFGAPDDVSKQDSSGNIPSFTASGSLATALRMKVDVAKHSLVTAGSEGSLESGNAPAKHVYTTPEKAPAGAQASSASKSGERVATMASESGEHEHHHEAGSDGWYSDEFVEEDEELQRLSASNRPRSADGHEHPSEADLATSAAIKSMSQSGPAAFATQAARRAVGGAAEQGDEQSSSKLALRRATTTGDSRHFVDKFEHLIHAAGDAEASQTLKSMTSRSASECNITFEPSELHSQSAKSSSSKYQVLRNLRSNKSSQKNLDRMELSAQFKHAEDSVQQSNGMTAEETQGAHIKGHEAQPPAASFSVLQPDHTVHDLHDEQAALQTEREEEDASPTLSEFSDAEEPLEIHQEQQRQRQALSPLRVESVSAVGETLEALRERTSSEGNQVDLADLESPLRWRKGEVIGEGTFGKVYKGMNEKTGELLAIKQLCLVDGTSVEVDSLCKEINVMWNLEHENIVRYMGTSKTERYLYIILEYVTGGSIAGMIAQFGPFNEKLMRRFTLHIMSGVEYLHSKGIIHRDIKGANILVSDAGIAKLADFGCSKQLAGMCTASIEESMLAIRGSVPWMAPEVIKQSGHGRASDIWSVGATVIEMATGKPPWSEFTNSLAALFHVATSKTPPPTPPDASPLCADFLTRCMVIDPAHRATAQELLRDCEFLSGAASASSAATTARTTRGEGTATSTSASHT